MERYNKKYLKESRVVINLDYKDAEFLYDFIEKYLNSSDNNNITINSILQRIRKILAGSL